METREVEIQDLIENAGNLGMSVNEIDDLLHDDPTHGEGYDARTVEGVAGSTLLVWSWMLHQTAQDLVSSDPEIMLAAHNWIKARHQRDYQEGDTGWTFSQIAEGLGLTPDELESRVRNLAERYAKNERPEK